MDFPGKGDLGTGRSKYKLTWYPNMVNPQESFQKLFQMFNISDKNKTNTIIIETFWFILQYSIAMWGL